MKLIRKKFCYKNNSFKKKSKKSEKNICYTQWTKVCNQGSILLIKHNKNWNFFFILKFIILLRNNFCFYIKIKFISYSLTYSD